MSPGSRISVEVSGNSASLQAATAKAADALKHLGDVLKRQTDAAVALGDTQVRSNDLVARSFQASAREAGLASEKTIGAFERQGAVALNTARQQTRASEEAATAAKQSATTQVRASEEAAAASTRAANTHVSSARRTEQAFGSSSSAITKAGKMISLGLVGAAAASIDLAVKFQANTLRMQTQAGATAKQLDLIRKGLLNMAGAVGYTPNQLANGMYHVVSSMNAVLPASQRVTGELKIMRIAAEGAQVGHSNLEDTTYALASAMNALHAPVSDAGKVMGQLNAIVGSGDMTMNDLLEALKSGLIPTAQTFGVSMQSVGAALSVMGDMGIRGALAGTRLRMSLALLGAPSEKAAKLLEDIGMKSGDAIAATQKMSDVLAKAGLRITTVSDDLRKPNGLSVALQDVNKHLQANGLSAQASAALISDAFGGGRSGAAIQLMAQNVTRLNAKFQQIGQSGNQFGADWQQASHTTAFELHSVEAGAVALATRLGTDLLPAVNTGIHDFTAFVDWLGKGNTAARALEITVGSLATVAIGSYLVSKLAAAVKLMREFGQVASNPLGAARGFGAATRPGAAGAAGVGGVLANGLPAMGYRSGTGPGSVANPLVVMVEAGDVGGLGSRSAAGMGTTESRAAQAERQALQSSGSAVPVGTGAAAAEATAASGLRATLKTGLAAALGGLMKGGLIAGLGITGSQLAGSAIGGGTGKTVQGFGTAASLGAGAGAAVGSIVPVVGTALGAGLGAATGVAVEGVLKLIHSNDYGVKIANSLTAGFGGAARDSLQKQLSSALDDANNHVHKIGTPNFSHTGTVVPPVSAADLAKAQADYQRAGTLVATSLEKGWSQYKFQSEPVMFTQLKAEIGKLPPQARAYAIQSAVSFAQGLERSGQLPKGAAATMLRQVEQQFPGFAQYLGMTAYAGVTQFTKAMDLTKAEQNTKTALNNMRGDFPQVVQAMDSTAGDVQAKSVAVVAALEKIIHGPNSTADMRDKATADLAALRSKVADDMTASAGLLEQKVSDMAGSIKLHLGNGAQIAGRDMQQFTAAIQSAMSAGTLATSVGMQLIAQATDQVIGALGGAKIPIPALIHQQQLTQAFGQGKTGASALVHATGGYVGQPGEKGRDAVPIVVGRGEAILNHQQQAVANQFIPGGLDAVYAATKGSRHYMASGGYAGYSLPLPKGEMMPGSWSLDQGVDIPAPAGTPEFAIGPGVITQEGIGGFGPNAPILRVTAGPLAGTSFYYGHAGPDLVKTGQTVTAGQQISEVGAGIVGISSGPHIEFGVWPPRGGAVVAQLLKALMGGAGVTGFGGAVAPQIHAPGVSGKGAVADIVRAALGKTAAAANAYVAAHTPAVLGSSGVTGSLGPMPNAGDWQGELQGIAKQHGWSVPDWMWLVQAESGGNPNAVNPSSGAFGLGQFLGATAQQYAWLGATSHDPKRQIGAMAQYIADRYGNPTAAKSFHIAHNWYAGGGYAGGTRATGRSKALKPTKTTKTKVGKAPAAIKTGMTTKDLQGLSAVGGNINTIETLITALSGRYQADTTLFPPEEGAAQYLNPDGSLNPAGYAKKIADDQTLLGIDQQLLAAYNQEVPIVSGELTKWLGSQSTTDATIRRNKTTLGKNKIREASIRKAILDLQKPTPNQVAALEDTISATRHQYDAGIHTAETGLQHYDTATATREAALRTQVLHAERSGGDPTASRLAAAVLNAERAQNAYTGSDKGTRQSLARAARTAELNYRGYTQGHPSKNPALTAARQQLSGYETSRAGGRAGLREAVDNARNDEFNALQPLQGALINARRAQRDRKFKISTEVFHLKEELAGLTKQDTKLTATDSNLAAILSGANGAGLDGTSTGVNATVTLLETIAGKLGTVNWQGGKFAGIDTTMPGEIVSVTADIQSLQNDIGQAGMAQSGAAKTDNSQLVSLLQQQNLQLSETLALNEAQTRVLQGMIPEIPRYEKGGPVIGDQLAQLHDEEWVVPRGGALVKSGGSAAPVNITIEHHHHGPESALKRFVDTRIQAPENVRTVSREIGRRTSLLTGAPGR